MQDFRTLTTKEKALQVNLDSSIYGSFAEIGAGQDVAANFFKSGGSSGTIAKTMSAYDMSFSDAIYGKSDRYVSEARLKKMLEHEYDLLIERLESRKDNTTFFAFADTVESINFKKSNKGHGWVGLRFQLAPNQEYNECIIHVNLLENDSIRQQDALGTLGVNLIWGCHKYSNEPEQLMNSLMDNLSEGRIEIDMFSLKGPDFLNVDNRLMALKLVKNGLTKAAMFAPNGDVLQPSQCLYKKNILVLRGRFRPVTLVNVDMIIKGFRLFKNNPEVEKSQISILAELTLQDLKADGNEIDDRDFLNRVDILCSMGQNVIISNYYEYYKLVDYLSEFTKKRKIGIILGINNLNSIFSESYYTDLKGGILEAFGSLFGKNIILFVYPSIDKNGGSIINLSNFPVAPKLKSLFKYLLETGKLEDVMNVKTENLSIVSDNVLKMIKNGEPGWESMVPSKVSKTIKENGLFDYKPTKDQVLPVDENKRNLIN